MTIQSAHNLYAGINPHLNSFLQQPDGGWEAFHAHHIVPLANLLSAALPAHYYAIAEKSLQLNTYDIEDEPDSLVKRTRPRPDISVYKLRSEPVRSTATTASTPVMLLPLLETFADEETLTAVMIYRLKEGKVPGTPVTRIELLSPGNKPGGSHYLSYLVKRQDTLKSGLNLVEMDYLHETRPILNQIPSYADGQPDAYAYTFIVSDPRPTLAQAQTQVYGVRVGEPLPIINIPLAGDDIVTFDFGSAYDATFRSNPLFSLLVDYVQEPVNFERYQPDDQAYIRARMGAIAAEHAHG